MEIILEQHCFTSVDPEFKTTGMSKGITEDERLLLEKHSIYFLPGELLYNDAIPKPVKYVFYPITSHSYVIGRGEYIGKDSLGRPGNYFFHNVIIKTGDLIHINSNPVPLINSLKKEGKFTCSLQGKSFTEDDFSGNSFPVALNTISHSFHCDDSFSRLPEKLDKESLKALLHFIYTYHEGSYPIVFHGNGDEILQYLDLLFSLLPYDQRIWLSFDTFAFGVPYSFMVFGIPEDSFYSHSFFSSLEIYLSAGQTRVHRNYTVSPVVSSTVELLFDGKQDIINKLLFLYDNLKKHPGTFHEHIAAYDDDFLALFYKYFHNELLTFILNTVDIALLHRCKDCIQSEEYSRILTTPGFIKAIARSSFNALHEKVLVWILNQERPGEYRIIIQNRTLWELFKTFVGSESIKQCNIPVIDIFLILIKVCKDCYKPEIENYLLKKLLLLTKEPVYYNDDIRKYIYKTIKKFPKTNDKETLFLRNFYKINKKKKIPEKFFPYDFTQYDRELREQFISFIIKAIKKKSVKKINSLSERFKEVLSDTSPVIKYAEDTLSGFLSNKRKTRAFLEYIHLLDFAEKLYSTSRGYKRIQTLIDCLKQG